MILGFPQKLKIWKTKAAVFRVKNKRTSLIKSAKSEFYLNESIHSTNNPKILVIKSSNHMTTNDEVLLLWNLVACLKETHLLDYFNDHFISARSPFESLNSELTDAGLASVKQPLTPQAVSGSIASPFEFISVSVSEVNNALTWLDTSEAAGPDQTETFFLKLAADFIAESLTYF